MPGSVLTPPSRAEPWTLVPAARALYERGFSQSEVLRAIYGVDLPFEATLFFRDFVNNDDGPPLGASWGTHPWELMIPLDEGGPSFEIPPHEVMQETRAYAQAPHVLLLGRTGYKDAEHGASLIGYDLNELHAGRTTVIGLEYTKEVPESGAAFVAFGPSLVAVFHELIVTHIALMERTIAMGLGPYEYDEVEEIRGHLASIESLEREIRERQKRQP